MDYLNPVFSIDQVDDFLQFSPSPPLPPLNPPSNSSRRRKYPIAISDHQHDNVTDNIKNPIENNTKKKKKILHRDVERQRRQEMTTLYRSLRSLLPLDYIKGKRSISDQMNEAVKYVRDLQKNIELLNEKRDELLRSDFTFVSSSMEYCNSHPKCEIKVQSCSGNVEVIVNTPAPEIGGLPVSRIVGALMEEEMMVVNSQSTKVNERLIHCIQCEIVNEKKIDLSKLKEKLEWLICL
ncbi:transcription factor bHLH118-like [Impatiens glandulifera]|uniref:transcription factor bHLH118-like n=1 Tax=Impatiens glandulifera TaxID=253017 RepID=UPI001FB0FE29|nr:transcription factor bHLH118-like [Impatiens glandulifera]